MRPDDAEDSDTASPTPMISRPDAGADTVDIVVPIDAIDVRDPGPPRSWQQVALEAALLLPHLVLLLTRLLRDPRVPLRHKMLVAVVVTYVVSPIDLVPDFIAGFGHVDDIVIVSVAIDRLLAGTSADIVLEHWDGSIDALDLVRSVFAWGAEIVPSILTRVLPRP
jgi:uncharacterized membrane protein YkvA (DUF1232 family)